MLDAVTGLDGKPIYVKGFRKFLRLIYFLSKISLLEFSFLFPNNNEPNTWLFRNFLHECEALIF